jgi:hypothetical protein
MVGNGGETIGKSARARKHCHMYVSIDCQGNQSRNAVVNRQFLIVGINRMVCGCEV